MDFGRLAMLAWLAAVIVALTTARVVGGDLAALHRRAEALGPQVSVIVATHDRLDRPLFIIDIAVPRDVARDVNKLEGVFLYDIDSLKSIAQQSLALRRQQISASEEIIAGHVHDFSGWFVSARERTLNPARLSEPSLRASES